MSFNKHQKQIDLLKKLAKIVDMILKTTNKNIDEFGISMIKIGFVLKDGVCMHKDVFIK